MISTLDTYAELFKVAHADVGTIKESIFGLGSSGRMAKAVAGQTAELSDEYLDAMARASKGTKNMFSGGPQAIEDAISNAGQVAQAAPQAAPQAARSGLGPAGIAGLLGLGGLGTAGGLTYGQSKGREQGERKRNLAFGAGVATGAVAPKLLQHAGRGIQALGGQMQQGEISPELLQQMSAYQGGYG